VVNLNQQSGQCKPVLVVSVHQRGGQFRAADPLYNGDFPKRFWRHLPNRMGEKLISILFGLANVLVGAGQPSQACQVYLRSGSSNVQWSENKNIALPDCDSIVLNHNETDDSAKAYFLSGSTRRYLFDVERAGTIYWDSSGKRLLYQDRIGPTEYRLIFVNLSGNSNAQEHPLRINDNILEKIKTNLAPGENIEQYWPNLVAWSETAVIVSISYSTIKGETGSFTPHCVGYLISTSDEHILSSFSESDLSKNYNSVCSNK
jgi:hypothetical protein